MKHRILLAISLAPAGTRTRSRVRQGKKTYKKLHMNTETFIAIVDDMRKAQKNYFRNRTQVNLELAKQKERECDAWLTAYYAQCGSDDYLKSLFATD